MYSEVMVLLYKDIWIRTDLPKRMDVRKNIVIKALENNFTHLIIREEDRHVFQKLGKFELLTITDGKLKLGKKIGKFKEIKKVDDVDAISKLKDKIDFVIVTTSNWKIIPLENLIAKFQKSKTKLLVELSEPSEAKVYLKTLEVGVDGVVLRAMKIQQIIDLRKVLDELFNSKLSLVEAKVTNIKLIGTGDRICIDTCSILSFGEGMLIGSQSNGLFLVHSESIDSEYVAPRPFRVNAGPVHSYILMTNDKTNYLSDLRSGDEVLVVSSSGVTRPVVIGRLKLETRPLIMLEAKYKNKHFSIILQNAETIRLVSKGKPISITELKIGEPVLIWHDEHARHFGMKVDESIIEK